MGAFGGQRATNRAEHALRWLPARPLRDSFLKRNRTQRPSQGLTMESTQIPSTLCYTHLLRHVPLFVTLWAVAHQAPLSMGFPRQQYWSGWPYSPPGDLLNPGIEPASPEALGSLPLSHWGSPCKYLVSIQLCPRKTVSTSISPSSK